MHTLTYGDIKQAADRIKGRVRPVVVAPLDPGAIRTAPQDPLDNRALALCEVSVAMEFMQYTGSFKARGAQNFILAHREDGTLPAAGIAIASGGNAGLACAWAAQQQDVSATVFLPTLAPQVKVDRLRSYGADVRLVGDNYGEALRACETYAAASGALASHAYADTLIAAGAGTLFGEIHQQIPDLETIVVSVGGGGLFAGIATAAAHHGVRVVAVEPQNCNALNAAIEAGELVDVEPDSIAADSLGATRTWQTALDAAQSDTVHSVLVPDSEITKARQALWDHRRIAVEHGAATALAALLAPANWDQRPETTPVPERTRTGRNYMPGRGEKVAVVLCGGNTNPSDLVNKEVSD